MTVPRLLPFDKTLRASCAALGGAQIWMQVIPFKFARIDFRNDDRVFGIKDEYRFFAHLRHWKDRYRQIDPDRDYPLLITAVVVGKSTVSLLYLRTSI